MPTTQPVQLQAATTAHNAAPGYITMKAAGGATDSGFSSGGDAVLAEEEDGSLLCSVCMEAPLSIMLAPCGHVELCHKCCESIRAADNLVRYTQGHILDTPSLISIHGLMCWPSTLRPYPTDTR